MPTSLTPRQQTFSDALATTCSKALAILIPLKSGMNAQKTCAFCPGHFLSGFPVSLNAHMWDASPGDMTWRGYVWASQGWCAASQGSTGLQQEVQLVLPLLLLFALAMMLSPGWPPSQGSWVTAAGEGTCLSRVYKCHSRGACQRTGKSQM